MEAVVFCMGNHWTGAGRPVHSSEVDRSMDLMLSIQAELFARTYRKAATPVKRIEVTYIKSEYPLGTTDGVHYAVVPRG